LVKGESAVTITTKQKRINRIQLLTVGFYAVTGILLLAFLPFTSFAPHIGLLGIVSLIAAYSVYMKRKWASWLVFILVVANSVFAGVTLFAVGLSNLLVTGLLIPFLVFTWVVTVEYMLLKRD
jgi:uncharacterized membrane protein HdeD (DUF308 family)